MSLEGVVSWDRLVKNVHNVIGTQLTVIDLFLFRKIMNARVLLVANTVESIRKEMGKGQGGNREVEKESRG